MGIPDSVQSPKKKTCPSCEKKSALLANEESETSTMRSFSRCKFGKQTETRLSLAHTAALFTGRIYSPFEFLEKLFLNGAGQASSRRHSYRVTASHANFNSTYRSAVSVTFIVGFQLFKYSCWSYTKSPLAIPETENLGNVCERIWSWTVSSPSLVLRASPRKSQLPAWIRSSAYLPNRAITIPLLMFTYSAGPDCTAFLPSSMQWWSSSGLCQRSPDFRWPYRDSRSRKSCEGSSS